MSLSSGFKGISTTSSDILRAVSGLLSNEILSLLITKGLFRALSVGVCGSESLREVSNF